MRRTLACLSLLPLFACGGTNATGNPDGSTSGNSLTVNLTPFTLQPGEEKIYCEYRPADGVERWINKFSTDLSPGSHHLVVIRVNEAVGKPSTTMPYECSQLDVPPGFDGMLPGSQQLHSELPLPDGVAMSLSTHHGLLFQEHYINATTSPLTTQVSWTIDTVDKSTVQQEAGIMFFNDSHINVPPMSMGMATYTCPAATDRNLIMTTGHMHMHGTSFDATVGSTNVFHTTVWSEPNGNIYPSPGFAVKANDPVTWTCQYNNTTDTTLVFGNSAVKNEMCIFAALYYPAPNSDTDFGCTF